MEKLRPTERHESQRGYFSYELHELMRNDDNIWLITADLGYANFDKIKRDFPDRFLNTGASEQAAMGIAVGMALEGKIPLIYSITPFLIYRPFETIRNYINHEQIPVKLVGGGRDKDYGHDGQSHWAVDTKAIMDVAFPNIQSLYPEDKEGIKELLVNMVYNGKPTYLNLKR